MSQQGHVVGSAIDILTEDEVQRIHLGVLDILENTGVAIQHEEGLRILQDAGCKVDNDNKRVRFPSYLVEESLRKCPSSFTVKARNPKYDLRVGGATLYFSAWAGKDCIDLDTLQRRPPTAQEFADAIRTLDYLDEAHWAAFTYGSVQEKGVSGEVETVLRAALRARNTEKASYIAGTRGTADWQIRIYEVAGSTPLVSVSGSPPLTFSGDQISNLLHAAEAGFPLKPCSGLALGANAPATLAGGLVQNCAECISVIVLAQIVSPGIGIIAHDYSQPFDMITGGVVQGAIERGLMGAAWSQIWRNYGIPRMTMISSDAKIPDYQCAMEKVMSVTLQALAGANIINFMGGVYDELVFSPVIAIIDNDIAHMVGRMLGGINVNDCTLAVDLIQEVGPAPGHFLGKKHTRDMWKEEQLLPGLADRLSYPEWVKRGEKDIITRASEKYGEILATHVPSPLSAEQNKEIDGILESAKRYYRKRGLA